MKTSEVAQLLAFTAAFDRRTIGDADVLAWHTVLGDVDYEQARAAVSAHYAGTRDWIMPADIRAGVRTHRNAALEGFQYQPAHPDETSAQYLARRRGQLAAVGDGRTAPEMPELPAGSRPVETRAIGRMPTDPASTPAYTPRSVRCPRCGAKPGAPCKTPLLGKRMVDVHPGRTEAWRAA